MKNKIIQDINLSEEREENSYYSSDITYNMLLISSGWEMFKPVHVKYSNLHKMFVVQ